MTLNYFKRIFVIYNIGVFDTYLDFFFHFKSDLNICIFCLYLMKYLIYSLRLYFITILFINSHTLFEPCNKTKNENKSEIVLQVSPSTMHFKFQ